MTEVSARRRNEVIDALRRGTVPVASLDLLAVGLQGFAESLDAELDAARGRRGVLKAVRGDYGSGKTFFSRWLKERALRGGFAASEVQVSETETPLHRLETVYRRLVENLSTSGTRGGALRSVIDGWFYTLEEEALAADPDLDDDALAIAAESLMDKRLAEVTRQAPMFAACLRGYRHAVAEQDGATADGLIAWLSGVPHVAASIKRSGASSSPRTWPAATWEASWPTCANGWRPA